MTPRTWALVTVAAAFAVFAPTLDHFFVSDDFLNFERNVFRTLADAIGFFSVREIDFYRPIPRLHFGILAGTAGDRTWVWNVVGVLLHGLAAVVAGRLASSLLGARRWAGPLAGVLFAVHFIHVEPVVWASGVTSVYVTLFVLLALLGFRRFRETGDSRHLTRSVIAFAAALASKETAVAFVPLLVWTTWWRPPAGAGGAPTPRWPGLREAAPYAVLLAAWLFVISGVERGGDASPYRMTMGPHVIKNGVFFALGGFLPLRFWELRDLWAASPGLGAFLAALLRSPGLGAPLLLGSAAVAAAFVRGGRDVRFAFGWIGLAAAPFLLLPGSGERFQYLPSFGACVVLAIGAERLLRLRRPAAWAALAAGAVLLLAGNLDRQADWRTAGRWCLHIVLRAEYLRNLGPEQRIEFVGVPESYRSAWVFRNGFDSVVRMYWGGGPYAREGRLPDGPGEPIRMIVHPHPSGTVGMEPEGAFSSP